MGGAGPGRPGQRRGPTSEELAEIKRLRVEVRDLKEANEILKAAAVNSTGQRNTLEDLLGGVAW